VSGIENEKEYSLMWGDSSGKDPVEIYLFAIAQKSMTPSQLALLGQLLQDKKIDEARRILIDSNSWVKQKYELIKQDVNVYSDYYIEFWLENLREIKQRAESISAVIDQIVKKDFEYRIAWFEAAEQRTQIMVNRILMLAKSRPSEPLALIIG